MTRIERYTPYGEPSDGGYDQGPGYTGHVTDSATGLTYMQQRYYDPAIGRFLSNDPVSADANTGGNFNRYSYAGNSPFSRVDPDGRRDIYVGGASDKNSTMLVQGYANEQMAKHPGRDIQYFSWSEGMKINAAMNAPLAKNEPLNVIGHSLGGSRAVQAANQNNVPITNLISIDPVGIAGGDGSKASNVSTWTNILASPSDSNFSDTVADFGRLVCGETLTGGANNLQSTATHGDFSRMMGEVGAETKIDSSYPKEPIE